MRVGDIGSIVRLTVTSNDVALDISTATTTTFKFLKPSGEVSSVTASFEGDGTDGVLTYTTVSGDIDESGPWSVQAYVVMTGGTWHSSTYDFKVDCNFS